MSGNSLAIPPHLDQCRARPRHANLEAVRSSTGRDLLLIIERRVRFGAGSKVLVWHPNISASQTEHGTPQETE
jgi:hypothetical protein